MTTLLLIIASSIAIAFGVIKLVKILSYSEKEEEIVPVENYDLSEITSFSLYGSLAKRLSKNILSKGER